MLVLGGDQVYPGASTRAYEDRTKGPYRAALPAAAGSGRCCSRCPATTTGTTA
ncbi:hypothetical protein ACFQV2_12045 [Actinokineospora soli]|uniref:Uncharacterized protein n=1 Tax=Actinokineospora soli TaxID=1048753 RepID=A0ABW2TLB7_9PSEU